MPKNNNGGYTPSRINAVVKEPPRHNSDWIESPEGDFYNLRCIVAIFLTRGEEKGSWDIMLRYALGGECEPDYELFHHYDNRDRADEDMAMLRSLINPMRLRTFTKKE